eukprot:3444431-Prymnesium_polylepis.1
MANGVLSVGPQGGDVAVIHENGGRGGPEGLGVYVKCTCGGGSLARVSECQRMSPQKYGCLSPQTRDQTWMLLV